MSERRFCTKPFTTLMIDPELKARVCCDDWLSTPIGSLASNNLMEVWNSPAAQALRESIHDGTFRYCSAERCPDLVGNNLPTVADLRTTEIAELIENRTIQMRSGPREINLAHDNTCNLKCPSCRSDFIRLSRSEERDAEGVAHSLLKDALPDLRTLIITGSGDAFSSRVYRRFLQNFDAKAFPNVCIVLMTNGLLFTREMWASMSKAHSAIKGVTISVDAATEPTYEVVRGGSFSKLLDNLNFVGTLVASGEIQWFEISFVVQAENFREMPAFVLLGKKIGCTSVLFQRLILWPHMSAYETAAVHLPENQFHKEFLKLLQAPILGCDIVDFSNLINLKNGVTPEKNANY